MSPLTFWLGRGLALTLALTLVLGGRALFAAPDARGRRALQQYLGWLDGKLRFVRSTVSPRAVVITQASLVVLLLLPALLFGQWPCSLLLPIVLLFPRVWLERQAARRVSAVEEQLEPWLVAVANALKASPSLGEAIASTTSLVPAPMSEEVEHLVKTYELGTPLDRALDGLQERIPSRTLAGTVLALKVARKSGGDLPNMLENAAGALRELARLEGVVRTKTAEGKAQAFVIGVIPLPMVAGIHAIDPRFFEPLAGSFLGHMIVAAATVLWALAILLARKILAVDV